MVSASASKGGADTAILLNLPPGMKIKVANCTFHAKLTKVTLTYGFTDKKPMEDEDAFENLIDGSNLDTIKLNAGGLLPLSLKTATDSLTKL